MNNKKCWNRQSWKQCQWEILGILKSSGLKLRQQRLRRQRERQKSIGLISKTTILRLHYPD